MHDRSLPFYPHTNSVPQVKSGLAQMLKVGLMGALRSCDTDR